MISIDVMNRICEIAGLKIRAMELLKFTSMAPDFFCLHGAAMGAYWLITLGAGPK